MRCLTHDTHDTTLVRIDYGDQEYDMFIYDWRKYLDPKATKWCPANDVISQNIETYGFWEIYETMLFDKIFSTPSNNHSFVDIGSQLGWYSLRAANKGFAVYAIEADEDTANLLKSSATKNGMANLFVVNQVVDENSLKLPDVEYKLVKVDIEGNEQYALKMLGDSFASNNIEYAIFEFSTQFNDSYVGILEKLNQYGYSGYRIPIGDEDWIKEFEADPLTALLSMEPVTVDDVNSWTRQENILFVRNK